MTGIVRFAGPTRESAAGGHRPADLVGPRAIAMITAEGTPSVYRVFLNEALRIGGSGT